LAVLAFVSVLVVLGLLGAYLTSALFTDSKAVGSNTFSAAANFNGAQTGLRTGVVQGVTNTGWTTVTPGPTYTSMVVVATANYDNLSPPLVTRVQNVTSGDFEVRVDRADGSSTAIGGVDVHWMVVEEGV